MRRGLIGLLAIAAFAAIGPSSARAQTAGGDIVVFAAASLKNALDAVVAAWGKETGRKAVVSYAASSALARQIEQDAPAELFISADLDWMDYVAGRGRIQAGSRMNLLGNRIVLIAPKGEAKPLTIAPGFDLAGALGSGRLAIADVAAVPAGKYGKAALEALGVWDRVAGRLAMAENVRAALLLVSRGEAPLGIVYQTDAAADPGVTIIGTFPAGTHPPIVYPVALTTTATAHAADLLRYMKSAAARPMFEAQGFTLLD